MSTIVVLPILVPLATAILALAVWRMPRLQRAVSVAGAAGHLASAIALLAAVATRGILAVQAGDWPAPFGITLVADHLGAAMVLVASVVGLAVAVYSLGDVDCDRQRHGFHPLYHVLLTGVSGAFLTGDLFNLYVWFEVMLSASFVLLALGRDRAQIDGAIKYAVINLVSTVTFLIAVGILYGMTGTLNMADLALRVPRIDQPGLLTAVAVLFLGAFGIKAAIFPLFFWLPASYHTPAVSVSALFAGLLTKVGVYALVRTFTLIFTHDVGYTQPLLLAVAGLTMVTGVLGAAAHNEARRILSFHIVSQIGYMIMGLALSTPLALAGTVFYVIHHIVVKTNLFLVAGLIGRRAGSTEIKDIGGLFRSSPLLAVLFLVPALSLAGVPPLSGFWAKLILVRAGLETQDWVIVGVALAVGLLTLFSMSKIWLEAFWKAPPVPAPAHGPVADGLAHRLALIGPVVALAAVTLWIGLAATPLMDLATRAAGELLSREAYIQAVLGGTR